MIFDSRQGVRRDLQATLEALRGLAGGRYACILEPAGVLLETPVEAEGGRDLALRRLLEDRRQALFTIPASMASGQPMEDVFHDWNEDEFLLAFLNGRVALVVASSDAHQLEGEAAELLRVWVDRMMRFDARYRLEPGGRGLFLGKPRLDVVVVGPSGSSS